MVENVTFKYPGTETYLYKVGNVFGDMTGAVGFLALTLKDHV